MNAVGVGPQHRLGAAAGPGVRGYRIAGRGHRRAPRERRVRSGSRKALLDVPRLGPKAFEQCAGFLRIRRRGRPAGRAPACTPRPTRWCGASWTARASTLAELIGNERTLRAIKAADFADERFGVPTVTDILARTGEAGPRPAAWRSPPPPSPPASRRSPTSRWAWCWRAWSPMWPPSAPSSTWACTRTVSVHVSAMADRFVSDPHEVVKSGQVVKVKVARRRRGPAADRADPAAQRRTRARCRTSRSSFGRAAAGNPNQGGQSAARRRSAAECQTAARTSGRRDRRRPVARWPRHCAMQVSGANRGRSFAVSEPADTRGGGCTRCPRTCGSAARQRHRAGGVEGHHTAGAQRIHLLGRGCQAGEDPGASHPADPGRAGGRPAPALLPGASITGSAPAGPSRHYGLMVSSPTWSSTDVLTISGLSRSRWFVRAICWRWCPHQTGHRADPVDRRRSSPGETSAGPAAAALNLTDCPGTQAIAHAHHSFRRSERIAIAARAYRRRTEPATSL